MGMTCYLQQLSPAQFTILTDAPTRIAELAKASQAAQMQEQFAAALERLPAADRAAHEAKLRAAMPALPGQPATAPNASMTGLEASGSLYPALSLGKAWHILHYLFTGEAIPTDSPAGALLAGEDTGDDFTGYGPARWIAPGETAAFANALSQMSLADLQSRLSLDEMSAAGVYGLPMGGRAPAGFAQELLNEIAAFFPRLQAYVADASARGNGMITWIS